MRTNYILAISGNDIFSGGGLHADLTTYTVNQLHGFVAVTCLTAMTGDEFEIFPTETPVFEKQLETLSTVNFSGIKIGLLPNRDIAKLAREFVKKQPHIPIVLDPVLVFKENNDEEISSLREEMLGFFPHVTIITPNLLEAELLSQMTIATLDDMKMAAKGLYELGAKAVVIKGGSRLDQQEAVDVFYDGQDYLVLSNPLLSTNNVGAGCTFASSIASYLTQGATLHLAVSKAKAFVYQAIKKSDQYGVIQYEKDAN